MNRTTDNMQDKTPYGAHDENDADMKLNFFWTTVRRLKSTPTR